MYPANPKTSSTHMTRSKCTETLSQLDQIYHELFIHDIKKVLHLILRIDEPRDVFDLLVYQPMIFRHAFEVAMNEVPCRHVVPEESLYYLMFLLQRADCSSGSGETYTVGSVTLP